MNLDQLHLANLDQSRFLNQDQLQSPNLKGLLVGIHLDLSMKLRQGKLVGEVKVNLGPKVLRGGRKDKSREDIRNNRRGGHGEIENPAKKKQNKKTQTDNLNVDGGKTTVHVVAMSTRATKRS